MRILLIILLFSVSLSAQDKKETGVKQSNVYTTVINGKSSLDGSLEMTRDEVLNSTITLKADTQGQTVPKLIALEVFIPGYPAIQIKGDKLNEETKNKIKGLATGNAVAIRGVVAKVSVDEAKNPQIVTTNITLKD